MWWFLGKISQESAVKLKNARKPNITRQRFQRPVYGKSNLSVTQILNGPVKIGPYYA